MASSATIQQTSSPVTTTSSHGVPDALLSMLILSMYGAQVSKKMVRKLKRRFFWTSVKLRVKSVFHPKQSVSDRTLIYILLGVALIALIVLAPVAALILAVLALVLILAGVI